MFIKDNNVHKYLPSLGQYLVKACFNNYRYECVWMGHYHFFPLVFAELLKSCASDYVECLDNAKHV